MGLTPLTLGEEGMSPPGELRTRWRRFSAALTTLTCENWPVHRSRCINPQFVSFCIFLARPEDSQLCCRLQVDAFPLSDGLATLPCLHRNPFSVSTQPPQNKLNMAHPQTSFKDTQFHGKSLLSIRRTTIAKKTLHTQLDQLRSTGRYDCFKLQWHPTYDKPFAWPVPLHQFWDSDIGKWIEAACYFLTHEYDEEIDKAIQELVTMIRSAQGEDGYLNLHYTVVEPGKRWTNLRDMHEL